MMIHLRSLTLKFKDLQRISIFLKNSGPFTFHTQRYSNIFGRLKPIELLYDSLVKNVKSTKPFTCRSIKDFSADDLRLQKYLNFILQEFTHARECTKSVKDFEKSDQNIFALRPIVPLIQEIEKIKSDIREIDALINDSVKQEDKELLNLANQDKHILEANLKEILSNILSQIVPEDVIDDRDIILEINAGVGGQEAMLFVMNLYTMYCNFAAFKGWNTEIVRWDETDIGGLRQAHLSISGKNVYKTLKFESGVHRVQRVPKTEKAGRIHTSTATVAILPQPTEIEIIIHPKDISLEFKRSSGAGGQHVNRTDSCVRITHIPSGIVVENQMERCQHKNRAYAMKTLKAQLYERELEKVTQSTNYNRKIQVGTAGRSEKVRTYNFPQNRITDHRSQQNSYDLDLYFKGQQKLDDFLNDLQDWSYAQSLNELLKKYE